MFQTLIILYLDGELDENWLLDFVIQKHLENLVENDQDNRIGVIVKRGENGTIEGNDTITQALLSPSDLFDKLLDNSESVINESHVYEELDLDYVTR